MCGLKQMVEMLTAQTKIQGEKIDRISHKVYAVIAVIVVVLAGIGWLITNLGALRSALELLSKSPPP